MGGKTFVYDKRNRAITCAFSRDLHLTLCSSQSSTRGALRYWVIFGAILRVFLKSTVLRFLESKYAVILIL